MYKSVPRLSVLKFITNDGLTSSRCPERTQIFRGCSGLLKKKEKEDLLGQQEISFTSFLQNRQDQAKRSVLIKLDNKTNFQKLFSLCSSCGDIQNIFHCERKSSQILLIEMRTESALNSFVESIQGNSQQSKQFIELTNDRFFSGNKNILKVDSLKNITGRDVINVKAQSLQNSQFLNKELHKDYISISEVIKNCFSCLQVSDFEIRNKFLICRQIELMCSGFLPNVVAYPFGSSVTGFGIAGCDLDISLLQIANLYASVHDKSYSLEVLNEEARQHLFIISHIMKTFMVGCEDLNFIQFARVPIVKFKNIFTDIECDLSMYNPHGVAVSQIFYSLATSDWRIRAVVIFIKVWAYKVGLVNKIPGSKLPNFSLSLLIIFFFQQMKILPPWNIFPCTDIQFLSEKSSLSSVLTFIKSRNENDKSLEEFFISFLEFYENFDFKENGISLREATIFKKGSQPSMFIENPIHPDVNVCHTVNKTTVVKTKKLFSEALKIVSERKSNSLQRLFSLKMT